MDYCEIEHEQFIEDPDLERISVKQRSPRKSSRIHHSVMFFDV